MGADLIATVLPKLSEREYEEAVDRAAARSVAIAAFNAGYQGDFGDDAEFGKSAAELVADEDDTVIDLIAAHAGAVAAIRAAAKNGARFILQRMTQYSSSTVFDASLLGGPDLLVVGGLSWGDDPFDGFRSVAVLAALLAAEC
jgi:hypothetical protein